MFDRVSSLLKTPPTIEGMMYSLRLLSEILGIQTEHLAGKGFDFVREPFSDDK
jgi:hypothetical protein